MACLKTYGTLLVVNHKWFSNDIMQYFGQPEVFVVKRFP